MVLGGVILRGFTHYKTITIPYDIKEFVFDPCRRFYAPQENVCWPRVNTACRPTSITRVLSGSSNHTWAHTTPAGMVPALSGYFFPYVFSLLSLHPFRFTIVSPIFSYIFRTSLLIFHTIFHPLSFHFSISLYPTSSHTFFPL